MRYLFSVYVRQDEKQRDFVRRYQELTGATHVFLDSYDGIAERVGLPSKVLLMTDDVDKVAAFATSRQQKQQQQQHRASSSSSYVAIRGSPPFFVEFLDEKTNKGQGLAKLCQLLSLPAPFSTSSSSGEGGGGGGGGGGGLPLSDVVALGDGDNDLEFLALAGRGVAMCNAR